MHSRSITAQVALPLLVAAVLPALASAHLATLHLSATVYDGHTSKGVYSSREKVDEGSMRIGEDSSSCTKRSSSMVHCVGSYRLTHGTISFAGTISSSSDTNRLAIIGGTGSYKGARGTVSTEYNRAGIKAKETISFR
jgi:hypothetical protein